MRSQSRSRLAAWCQNHALKGDRRDELEVPDVAYLCVEVGVSYSLPLSLGMVADGRMTSAEFTEVRFINRRARTVMVIEGIFFALLGAAIIGQPQDIPSRIVAAVILLSGVIGALRSSMAYVIHLRPMS